MIINYEDPYETKAYTAIQSMVIMAVMPTHTDVIRCSLLTLVYIFAPALCNTPFHIREKARHFHTVSAFQAWKL